MSMNEKEGSALLSAAETDGQKIVGEDTGKREEGAKHFRLSDGLVLAAAYSEPVHFDENGTWVEIDNRLARETVSYHRPGWEQARV